MTQIVLTNGDICVVDDDNYKELSRHNWFCKRNKHTSYAFRRVTKDKIITTFWMHREILGISGNKKLRADHIDHDGLNNKKNNLRLATHSQNNCYKLSAQNSTSQFLGVSFCKQTGKWRATIFKNYKQTNLGRFDNEADAAIAYNVAAKKYHGEFANLNKV